MDAQAMASVYDKIGHHWVAPTFDLRNGIAAHERAVQFVRNRQRAIDVGCGPNGRFLQLLQTHGFEGEGVDISPVMLALAREKMPGVVFHQADICTWEFPRHYDFISAWDSIWHVPLDRHPLVLKKVFSALTPGGVLVFTSGGVDAPGEVTNPCHGEPLYHAALGIPRLLQLIDEAGCVCRHLEYDQLPPSHLYLIVQKPA